MKLFLIALVLMQHISLWFLMLKSTIGLQARATTTKRLTTKIRKGKSQAEKLAQISPNAIPSSEDLRTGALATAFRTPGSLKYIKKWRYWSERSIDAIRYQLWKNLPHEADSHGFNELFYKLGAAADNGEMPSFADAGSRSGYALEFFCRAKLLADLLFDQENPTLPSFWGEAFDKKHLLSRYDKTAVREPSQFNMVSLGGGPGYDYVGALLAKIYISAGSGTTHIQGTILDYEEGWHDLVHAMNIATNATLNLSAQGSSVRWGGKCDITKPLTHPSNTACLASLETTDLYVCQYTVAENVRVLRESEYVFFADLFEAAKDDTIFIFTETTPRLWPEFADVLLNRSDGGEGFEIGFPRVVRRGTSGPQLVIRKKRGANFCALQMALTEEYRRFNELHERKIGNGYERPGRKIRGSKV